MLSQCRGRACNASTAVRSLIQTTVRSSAKADAPRDDAMHMLPSVKLAFAHQWPKGDLDGATDTAHEIRGDDMVVSMLQQAANANPLPCSTQVSKLMTVKPVAMSTASAQTGMGHLSGAISSQSCLPRSFGQQFHSQLLSRRWRSTSSNASTRSMRISEWRLANRHMRSYSSAAAASRRVSLPPWVLVGAGVAAALGVAAYSLRKRSVYRDLRDESIVAEVEQLNPDALQLPLKNVHGSHYVELTEKPHIPLWRRLPREIYDYIFTPTPMYEDGQEAYRVPRDQYDMRLPPVMHNVFAELPYTICIELNGVLCGVHTKERVHWKGVRVRERLFAKELLDRLHQAGCELILYTREPMRFAFPLLLEIDLNQTINHLLFAESFTPRTHGIRTFFCHDVESLGRDPKRTIVLTTDQDRAAKKFYPDNSLPVKAFAGHRPKDVELVKACMLIETIIRADVKDVRPVLRAYQKNPNASLEELVGEQEAIEAMQGKMLWEYLLPDHSGPKLPRAFFHEIKEDLEHKAGVPMFEFNDGTSYIPPPSQQRGMWRLGRPHWHARTDVPSGVEQDPRMDRRYVIVGAPELHHDAHGALAPRLIDDESFEYPPDKDLDKDDPLVQEALKTVLSIDSPKLNEQVAREFLKVKRERRLKKTQSENPQNAALDPDDSVAMARNPILQPTLQPVREGQSGLVTVPLHRGVDAPQK